MPIDYTGTSAGLFVRLGKLVNAGKEHRIAQGTLVTHIEEAMGKYTATSIDRTEYLGALNGDRYAIADANGRRAQEAVRGAMEKTIIEQVDAELSPKLDPSKTIDNALRRLSIDMQAQSQAIGTTSIAFSGVTNASTNFDGTILMSENRQAFQSGAKKPAAVSNDTILAETLTVRCVRDSKDGSLIPGNERFEVSGESQVNRLDHRWPRGSGSVLGINATCGDIDSSGAIGQNILTNSGFERVDLTPFPLDWLAAYGTIGTNLTSKNTALRGSRGLMFTGDGTNARGVYQVMGVGPRSRIRSNTCYVISAWVRADTADVNDGIVQFGLADSSNTLISGTVAVIDASSQTILESIWRQVTFAFTTPLNLPSEVRFLITTTAGGLALPNNAKVIIDEVVLAQAYVLYPGGPACVIVPGTANFELGDEMQVSIAKTENAWHLELNRYLDLNRRNVAIPVAAASSTTISTSLIA
jgi:hypothetical protein